MLTALLLSSIALAQSPEDKPTDVETIYPKETIVDMTGAEITGTIVKPNISFVSDWKPHHEGSLIRLRTSFAVEMNQSVSDVK